MRIQRTLVPQEVQRREMKIKTKPPSSSKIKVGSKCVIVTLSVINVAILLVLVPMHLRLLAVNAPPAPESPAHYSVAASRRTQPEDRVQQTGSPPFVRRHAPTIEGVPAVGEETFNRKYAAYKGLLPSSTRDLPDPTCGTRPDFFRFFTLPKTERSRFHEDKIIYDLFKNTTVPSSGESPLPEGTYVELGAFDGKDESNSMFFDKCLGWQGLLIEAQAQSYQKVIENRPHAIKLSFSPTCKNEHEVERFYDYPLSNSGVEGLAKSYTGKETIEVPCGSLTSVLLDVFGSKLSFFSLDVEGAELKVLETLDFTVLSIEVIMVEIQNSHCPEANCVGVHNIRRRMAATGKYALFVEFLEASDVYVLRTSPAWRTATDIQNARKQQMQSEMHDRTMVQQQPFVGSESASI